MTAVFVHGVPEDAHLWDDLRAQMQERETVALTLPGFGVPVPDGFDATKEAYIAWLSAELERFAAPVDLVGHDWGGGFVGHVALTRPELIRTWASDTLPMFNPRSVWHDLAQKWQTPGVGEQVMAFQAAMPPEKRVALLVAAGMTEPYARHVAPTDALRDECILKLYRSATSVFNDWRATGPTARPGLYIAGGQDQYASLRLGLETAEVLEVQTAIFDDLGHWWALQDPARGAAALASFWESV